MQNYVDFGQTPERLEVIMKLIWKERKDEKS